MTQPTLICTRTVGWVILTQQMLWQNLCWVKMTQPTFKSAPGFGESGILGFNLTSKPTQMNTITLYHNPNCSKSRQTLELLRSKGLNPVIIEYMQHPLNLEELTTLRGHFALSDFVRTDEATFKEAGLSLDNEAEVLQAMVKEPKLMQRPIVMYKGKAVIGRPPEKILELF